MKRFILVLVLLLLIGGGGVAWWLLRDTPQKVLRDATQAITTLQSVGALSAEIAITDVASRTTSGYSFDGLLDTSDISRIRGLGVLRIGAVTQQNQDESLDLVLHQTSLFLRPVDVTADHRAQYSKLSGDATGTTFLAFDRAIFLDHFGYGEAVAKGKTADIRDTFQSLLPTMLPGTMYQEAVIDGRKVITTDFRFNTPTLRPFLIALVKSWTGKSPTSNEYAWIERATVNLGRGAWTVTLDAATRMPIALNGDFPLTDTSDTERQRVHFTLNLDELNVPVKIVVPINKDVTSVIRTAELKSLPGAETRIPPPESIIPEAPPSGDRQAQIDLFSKLQEQMLKKKRMY